ncbi:hypothetical protein AMATHDRAFT_47886 [Amanita thiersii Skay4041]|uniref:TOG domain-containing protein n=1 Tax=Amanita thiersii Skay4041 TaxID=703135 RepID=A0A2A9NIQ5_9AGAR|nr:hypothetical protein AMATHDRAFT_47886 [Amanita thiersii Skay4041]
MRSFRRLVIRGIAGRGIVALLGVLEPRKWPEGLHAIINALDSPDMQEVAICTLEIACEDFSHKLDFEINGNQLLDTLIPKFLLLSDHSSAKIRSQSLKCLSFFIPTKAPSRVAHTDDFIACLLKRVSDDDPLVRRCVCQALVLLLAKQPKKLVTRLQDITEYMLSRTKDKNKDIALEACKFWLLFAEDVDLAPHLQTLLGKVAPILLERLVYSKDDLPRLGGDVQDNAAVPSKYLDIEPNEYGQDSHGLKRDCNSGTLKPDEEDHADRQSDRRNLRQYATIALSTLASQFSKDILNVLLEPVKEKLRSDDWLQRESAILALGIIAKGCVEAIGPHLPTLISYLNEAINDDRPLIRTTTCWTFGQYTCWYTHLFSEEYKATYFIPAVESLLRMALDNNERVQDAGCSAFMTLTEAAGSELVPFLEPVLRNFVLAFKKYQRKNMLILYQVLGKLADNTGDSLQNPICVEILMPPVMAK